MPSKKPQLRNSTKGTYKLEELLAVVNEMLDEKELQNISVRTLRYYIQRGFVSRPIGVPKHARYSDLHLFQALAIRCLQLRSVPLEEIEQILKNKNIENLRKIYESHSPEEVTPMESLTFVDLTPWARLETTRANISKAQADTLRKGLDKWLAGVTS